MVPSGLGIGLPHAAATWVKEAHPGAVDSQGHAPSHSNDTMSTTPAPLEHPCFYPTDDL